MLTANEILEWDLDGIPPPPQPVLQVDGVFKHFTSRSGLFLLKVTAVRAVDGVSLTILEGETVGIAGVAGCGKSTIRRLLTGTTKPDAGAIVLDDVPIKHPANRAKVQLIAGGDLTAFDPGRTIEAGISMACARRGMTRTNALAQARLLLSRVGFGSTRIATARRQDLSGDEAPRAAMAAALAANPRLLILDEPFAGLSLSRQVELAGLLRGIAGEFGLTCLLLTREQAIAATMSTRTLAMRDGRLIA